MTPKPDLFLHVGMDKTGTSAIQFALHEVQQKLVTDFGILVPQTGLWSDFSHHPFAFAAFGINEFTQQDLGKLLKNLESEIRDASPKAVLLTSECLFKLPGNPGMNLLWPALQRMFNDIKVIIYVRRQDHWVESRYRHSVISGRELPLRQLSGDQFSNYIRAIDAWAEVVGLKNVIVRPFERGQFASGDIAADFESVIGLPEMTIPRLDGNRHNVAFPNQAVLFRSVLNHLGLPEKTLAEMNRLLPDFVGKEKKELSFMSPEQAAEVVERHRGSNEEIARKYLNRADGRLFLDPAPDPSARWIKPRLGREQLIDIVAKIKAASPSTIPLLHSALLNLKLSGIHSRDAAMGIWDLWSIPEFKENPGSAAPAAPRKPSLRTVMKRLRNRVILAGLRFRSFVKFSAKSQRQVEPTLIIAPTGASAAPAQGIESPHKAAPSPTRKAAAKAEEICVHFGIFKTGSTSIQHTLFQQMERLENCAYVHSKIPNGSLMVRNALQSDDFLLRNETAGASSSDVDTVRQIARMKLANALETAKAKSNRLVLSAEVITSFNTTDLTELKALLSDHAQKIHFYGYMRDPVSLCRSVFQETIKNRMPEGFEFNRYFSRPSNMYRIVERLDAVFGRDNVTVVPFERSLFPQGDVVQHFIEMLQIKGQDLKSIRVNEGLSLLAVKALYCYRKFGDPSDTADRNRSRRDFLASLQTMTGGTFALSQRIEADIRSESKDWDDWAMERMGMGWSYPEAKSEGAIDKEADLMIFSPQELETFGQYAAEYRISGITSGSTPSDVAAAMQGVRRAIASNWLPKRSKATSA